MVIQDNVVIGGWAMILPGYTVGEGAVIASGAVVVKNVDPYTLVAGNPAVKTRDRATAGQTPDWPPPGRRGN